MKSGPFILFLLLLIPCDQAIAQKWITRPAPTAAGFEDTDHYSKISKLLSTSGILTRATVTHISTIVLQANQSIQVEGIEAFEVGNEASTLRGIRITVTTTTGSDDAILDEDEVMHMESAIAALSALKDEPPSDKFRQTTFQTTEYLSIGLMQRHTGPTLFVGIGPLRKNFATLDPSAFSELQSAIALAARGFQAVG